MAPKRTFVALEFLNYLISLTHDSHNFNWIKLSGVYQNLLAKLTSAKRLLEKGDTQGAKNVIGAFLNELTGITCQDFSCPADRPLTSEAFTLLFYNGQYLFDRL